MADFAKENQFTPDQQAEIDAGIKDNIDVSIYAKPEFLAIQMHEIRIGLVEQIPVSYYADSRYDWFQMEETFSEASDFLLSAGSFRIRR